MDWYYAQNNQQQGPVTEVEFSGLVTAGIVTDQTLVWHEGMADWQPYGEVKSGQIRPPAPPLYQSPVAAPGPNEVVCAECGLVFPRDQTLQLGSVSVCAACKPIHIQKIREGVNAPQPAPEERYAGFWIRFVAKFIDGIILFVIVIGPVLALTFALAPKTQAGDGPSFQGVAIQGVATLFELLIRVAYNTFFIGRFGATPGKMALGLKVIMAEGGAPSYWRAFGRAWAEQLSRMVCLIGYIIAGFDDQKRALHDHLCSTRVVFK
jgi:uncharacterized RDD family membrane protein YckC